MNLTEYNAMPEGDLKLTVRTAVTCGWWEVKKLAWLNYVQVKEDYLWFDFAPFTDASIICGLYKLDANHSYNRTFILLERYCAADPLGHWYNFLKGE